MPVSDIETLQEICKRPGFMLKRIHQVAMALFLEECKQFGITPSQYQALAGVRAYPGITQTALGRLIGQDRSTIALVVKSLLDRKLIRMTASSSDRRSLNLKLATAGSQVLRQVAPAARHAQDRLLAPLPKEHHATFLALLTTLLDGHGVLLDPQATS
jgi:DNA-binding MarR family transcriptional regulator